MYNWRKLTDSERSRVLAERKFERRPWHAPHHVERSGATSYIFTAACFEHKHIIGASPERIAECESELLDICDRTSAKLFAWCVLPNHYHLLIGTDNLGSLLAAIGRYHGSSSYRWNGEDGKRGRKVWFRSVERSMKSEGHFYASLNYIHHNPVKHGYVTRWQDWPYSSAGQYLIEVGRTRALETWEKYPVLDYGKEWDID